MRNGNGTYDGGSGGGGNVQPVKPLECDVRLGLNTEPSYPYKKTSVMANSTPCHNQNLHYQCHQASEIFGFYGGLTNTTAGVNTGLRLSNGLDSEPWRCRRTDGKKWRCSKDVAPNQKYCERHSHKTRNRSRKHVETQSHHTKDNPTMLSAANQQTRCYECFLKNGGIPVSEPNNQFQQPMNSPGGGSKGGQILKPDFKRNQQQNSYLQDNNLYLNTSRTGGGIDSWSRSGSEDDCSLTLLMQSSGNGSEFDHESFQMAVGMLSGDRIGCGDEFKPHYQWLNQASWGGLTPGGPLGEALCLGVTGSSNMLQDEPSPHGYNNSTPGGDHVLGFIK